MKITLGVNVKAYCQISDFQLVTPIRLSPIFWKETTENTAQLPVQIEFSLAMYSAILFY